MSSKASATAKEERLTDRGEPSYEAIARRAYEIFESGEGGSAEENWERARRELSGANGEIEGSPQSSNASEADAQG